MKKLLPVLAIIVIAAGWWFVTNRQTQTTTSSSAPQSATGGAPSAGSTPQSVSVTGGVNGAPSGDGAQGGPAVVDVDDEAVEAAEQIRSATEVYTSAEEALAAVTKGSKDFDDSILEQFTQPGEDCSWCGQFYLSVRDLVTNPNTPQDQKSYLSEILAISGRVENIQALTEAIKNASSTTEADIYAEALELTMGKDDVTRYLGEQLSTTNDTLREAAVSALTNQGTRSAAETLMKHVQERGDPDGYYSIGIGPGEFVPDEEALQLAQEYVQRRDQYSPMWAKAMINSGLPGLRMLFENLEASNNPEADRALLKDALDHVNFEDGIKELTDTVIMNNGNQAAVEFAKQIQEEFSQQAEDDTGTTQP